VAERYFTPAEVEALIPHLTRLMGEVMERQPVMEDLTRRVKTERERLSMVGGGMPSPSWREDTARLERVREEVQERLNGILAMGGVPKDLGIGLVDFLHLRDGREVNLCWKYGEDTIGFWHGLDEGFAKRKPL